MSPRRLYLDNAATSFPKPSGVIEAMVRYAQELGASAGRGAYREAVETAAMMSECRRRLNKLFNGENPDHFCFHAQLLGCAESGHQRAGRSARGQAHAICTHIDHNSILRPLRAMEEYGWIETSRVAIEASTGLVDPQEIRRAIRPDTKLIAITHVSNVTGAVQPIREIGRIAREAGIPFIVDAAQSAGHLPIDVRADHIDLLAAPGHKGLLGPLGTGFLYIRPGLEKTLRPLKEGGTGSASEEDRQPAFMPDRFEPGSHNAIGIAGLSVGVKWVMDQGIEKLAAHDRQLTLTFIEGVGDIAGLTYYGPQGPRNRIGVFSVRVEGYDPHELSAVLETHYGILTRPGIHCAPLAHEAIGTAALGGTTRFSFGPFVTAQDVQYATDALAQIAMESQSSRLPAESSKA